MRDCVSVCPNHALYFGFGPLPVFAGRSLGRASSEAAAASPIATESAAATEPGPEHSTRHYPLTWGEEIALAIAFAAGFFAFRGLFGEVPFLMSLGLAGVLAFLTLLALRLASRRDFAYRHRTLKRAGRLQPAGWRLAASLLLLALFWLYCGLLQVEVSAGRRLFAATARARQQALEIAAETAPTTAAERAAAQAAARHFSRAARWGLLPWRGLDSSLAWSSWIAGDLAAFRTASVRAIARHDSAYEMLLLSGRDAAGRGDLAALALAGERAIALAPARLDAYAGVGLLLARNGAADAAASFFERGLTQFPNSTLLLYNWGIIDVIQGNPELAIGKFQKVLAIDPAHREARENLAGMLAATGRMQEAAALYREAIIASPRDADLHVFLAQSLQALGQNDAARIEVEAALKIDPSDPRARLLATALANHTRQ